MDEYEGFYVDGDGSGVEAWRGNGRGVGYGFVNAVWPGDGYGDGYEYGNGHGDGGSRSYKNGTSLSVTSFREDL